jgi:transcriptional regulator with XRE-family HTH domain
MDKGETRRLGNHLKLLREERKLTLGGVETLSEGFGERINKSYLFRVERGKTVPTIPRLRALAKVYRVKLSMLLDILEGAFEEQEKEARLDVDISTLGFEDLRQHGIDAERQGDFARATLFYRTALDRTLGEPESSDRTVKVATVRHDLAIALANAGHLFLAREEAESALEEDGLQPDLSDKIKLTLAIIYRKLNLTVVSQDLLASLLSRSTRKDIQSGARAAMGSVLLRRNPKEAAVHYRVALTITRQLKKRLEECIYLYNIALAEIGSGNLSRALKTLQRTKELAKKRDYSFWLAKIQTEIGKTHYLMGNRMDARHALHEANDLARTGEYFEQLFMNQFYLRRIAIEEGNTAGAGVMAGSLRYFAT